MLSRYASRLSCVEINSSFYRSHRPATYARWAGAVPEAFRFSVKLPREITHKRRLRDCDDVVDQFCDEVAALGTKLGVVLVQLPPSFAFDAQIAAAFFAQLARRTTAVIACEPRHPSWFGDDADIVLRDVNVARAAADPAVVPRAAEPGGSRSFSYYRLHGSPKIYASEYSQDDLARVADALRLSGRDAWGIFDNTQFGAATANALALQSLTTKP